MTAALKGAVCRGCGLALKGKPYHEGGGAYHPRTDERCKHNFYGGYVCSAQCDFRVSLTQEQSMPGHDHSQTRLSVFAQQSYNDNWSAQ